MNKVYLYNQDFFWPAALRGRLKAVFGRPPLGPEAVFKSLQTGLLELGQSVLVNQKNNLPKDAAVCVLSGANVLKWAISQKKLGKIAKIITGPNIVILPSDENWLLKDASIDCIVVPSQWVKDLYIKQAPDLAQKIAVWAAGVDFPQEPGGQKVFDFLILNKVYGNGSLEKQITDYLAVKNYKYQVLVYGKFDQQKYFGMLDQSKYLIYLSASESQGLAVFEAWARDVPTLVWDKGIFKYRGLEIVGNIASPYLTAQCGLRFKDFSDFTQKLESFLSAKFSPQEYVKDNFTNRICAQKYLDLVYAR